MKFKLIEGYEKLWKQFNELITVGVTPDKANKYQLHHIYNKISSTHEDKINYLILPTEIHVAMPKETHSDRSNVIRAYEELKQSYPDAFRTINVCFEVLIPNEEQHKEMVDKLKQDTKNRKNASQRERRLNKKMLRSNNEIPDSNIIS